MPPPPPSSETSPLLPKNLTDAHSRHPIDPSGALSPEGADPYEDGSSISESELGDGEDGGDIERQASNGDGDMAKHQGLPEVRARMKYIFPAIAVGVRIYPAIPVPTYSAIIPIPKSQIHTNPT